MTDAITKAKRTIAGLTISLGAQTLRNDFVKFPVSQITGKQITDACNKIGITNTQLDVSYFSVSWDDYKEILDTLYGVVKNFKWTEDKYDCDNRSMLLSSLVSLTAILNTCAGLYCEVKTANGASFRHWANLVIDKNGELYIFDCDNGGLNQKLTSKNFTMGAWTYELLNTRIG